MRRPLLIVGASARAAAFSARRAGFSLLAVDLFADQDLAAVAETSRVAAYPNAIVAAAETLVAAPWMYTGGLENHPELVDRLAANRQLYGNRGEVLRDVRDPFRLAAAWKAAGLRYPEVHRRFEEVPLQGSWLRKPVKSCGGSNIEPVTRGGGARANSADWYYQRRIAGIPCGATFVAAAGHAVLLGVTRQIIGQPWTGASEFQYSGSLGPRKVTGMERQQWVSIGNLVSRRFRLRGLFGVDAIVSDSHVWALEVNPRYPASVEVLERAGHVDSIRAHVAACAQDVLPPAPPAPNPPRTYGKAILFADRDFTFSHSAGELCHARNAAEPWPALADIPAVGTEIRSGRPVATVMADAANLAELTATLRQRVDQLRQWCCSA